MCVCVCVCVRACVRVYTCAYVQAQCTVHDLQCILQVSSYLTLLFLHAFFIPIATASSSGTTPRWDCLRVGCVWEQVSHSACVYVCLTFSYSVYAVHVCVCLCKLIYLKLHLSVFGHNVVSMCIRLIGCTQCCVQFLCDVSGIPIKRYSPSTAPLVSEASPPLGYMWGCIGSCVCVWVGGWVNVGVHSQVLCRLILHYISIQDIVPDLLPLLRFWSNSSWVQMVEQDQLWRPNWKSLLVNGLAGTPQSLCSAAAFGNSNYNICLFDFFIIHT